MKKWLKIGILVILGLLLAMVSFPVLYKNKVIALVKMELSKVSGAKIEFKDLNLSLFKSFPDLNIRIDSLTVMSNQTFTDTELFSSTFIYLDFDLVKLIKSGFGSFEMNRLILDSPILNMLYSKTGHSNLEGLFLTDSMGDDSKATEPMSFNLEQTQIKNGSFSYHDSSAQTHVTLINLNHEGKLEYTPNRLNINQKSTFDQLDFSYGPLTYLSKVSGAIDGGLIYLSDSNRLEFRNDSIILNQLKAHIDGHLGFNDSNTEIDIHIITPKNDLAQLVSLIPGAYQHHFDQLTTRGSFILDTKIRGLYTSTGRMPEVELAMKIKQGQIKYGHLPYPIDDIDLDYTFKTLDSSFTAYVVDVPNYHFRISDDQLNGQLNMLKSPKNRIVKGKTAGKMNLQNLNSALPIDSLTMSGKLDFDASYAFDNDLILKNKLDQLTLDGQVVGDKLAIHYAAYKPITVNKITATLNPAKSNIRLDSMHYGRSDVSGDIQIINPLAAFIEKAYLSQFIVSSRSKLIDIDEISFSPKADCDTCSTAGSLDENDFALRSNISFNSTIQNLKYADYAISSVNATGNYKRDSLALDALQMNINGSSISAYGHLINPYRWSNQSALLSGNIEVQSKFFDMDPWMSKEVTNADPAVSDTLFIKSIPAATDLVIHAKSDQVKYDGWILKDVNFKGRLKDQALEIEEGKSSLFGGSIYVNGLYSELGATPDFNLKLDLTKLRIEDMFKTSKSFAVIAPVAAFLEGLFSTSLIMQGRLNKNRDPIWNSFDAAGVLETVNGLFSKFKPLEEISKKIQLPLINYFKWGKSKNWFEIEKGKISVKPFVIQHDEINLTISGSQQIDQLMDYNVVLSIPRKTFDKYKVGLNANASLDWLKTQAAAKGINLTSLDTIYVSFNLQGTFDKPSYTLNFAENPSGKSVVDQIKVDLANSIQQKADSLKDLAEVKIQTAKDSIVGLIKTEVNHQKEQFDSLAKVVEDSLKKIAEKQAKALLDSILKKETAKILDSAFQSKVDTLLGKKVKEEIDVINEKLKNWNPFKKKPEKEKQ